jgi:hypothetical protein
LPVPISRITRFAVISLTLHATSSRTTACGVGDHRQIGAGVIGNFQPAFDHIHGSGAVWQDRQNGLLVHPIGARDADRDLDLHRIDRQPDGVCDAKGIVPQRVPQRAHRRLGVIRAADVGPHADLQHHALQSHRRLPLQPVIPAKGGIQSQELWRWRLWTPACAAVTVFHSGRRSLC